MLTRSCHVAAALLAALLAAGCESLAGLGDFIDGSPSGGAGGTGSGAMGTGANGGDGAGGACVPDCAGRTCGDDGCNGVCGTCDPGVACSDAGDCCELWSASYGPGSLQDMAVSGSSLFTVTTDVTGCITTLREHSTCDGEVVNQRQDFGRCSAGRGVLPSAATVYLSGGVGDDDGDGGAPSTGWLDRLEPDLSGGDPLYDASANVSFGRMMRAPTGDLWLSGDAQGQGVVGWSNGTALCRVALLDYNPTRPLLFGVHAVVASTNNNDGSISLKKLDINTCSVTSCSCAAAGEMERFTPDVPGFKVPHAMVASGPVAYVAGTGDAPNARGFITSIDLAGELVADSQIFDPTLLRDAWFDIVIHDGNLYVSGTQGLDLNDLSTAEGVIRRYALPWDEASVPLWTHEISGIPVISRLAVDATGRVFAGGSTLDPVAYVSACASGADAAECAAIDL